MLAHRRIEGLGKGDGKLECFLRTKLYTFEGSNLNRPMCETSSCTFSLTLFYHVWILNTKKYPHNMSTKMNKPAWCTQNVNVSQQLNPPRWSPKRISVNSLSRILEIPSLLSWAPSELTPAQQLSTGLKRGKGNLTRNTATHDLTWCKEERPLIISWNWRHLMPIDGAVVFSVIRWDQYASDQRHPGYTEM